MYLQLDSSPSEIEEYLKNRGWITLENTVVSLEKPGDGNMNVVARVKLEVGSLILKQSRPYVNKYPDIPAPQDRIEVEAQFYQSVSEVPGLISRMPLVIGFDADFGILAMEDLGRSSDFTYLYQKEAELDEQILLAAITWLNYLHGHEFPDELLRTFPDNLSLRRLNHEHIFQYPFVEQNGFDLDSIQPGLQELSMTYKRDVKLKRRITDLGNAYLAKGLHLLHGDYYPGSWLNVKEDFHVIDPEFSYFGPAEFDLGVMIAHLRMSQQPESLLDLVEHEYQVDHNQALSSNFEGVEIMRRIIGLAQLPLDLTLDEKQELLEHAYHRIMN